MSILKEPNYVCDYCGVSGYKRPSHLSQSKNHYCSYECSNKSRDKKIEVECLICKNKFKKRLSLISKSKDNNFCSRKCHNKFQDKKVEVKCLTCGTFFMKVLSHLKRSPNNYCSRKCFTIHDKKEKFKSIEVECLVCKKIFLKKPSNIKRAPRHCCSRDCYYILNREKKDWGSRRSRLEIAIEEHLSDLFSFEIRYNKTDIGYELDIYIPELKLAIEINGIFHYKAIFGEDTFKRRQEIDNEKIITCRDKGIELIVIDVSGDKSEKILLSRVREVEDIIRSRMLEKKYVGQMVLEI